MDDKKLRDELEQLILQGSNGANKLTIMQEVLLSMMIDKHGEYQLSRNMLMEEGMTIKSDNRSGETIKASPAISSSDLTMKAFLLLAKELQIAPNNQSVLETKAAIDGGFDPFKRPEK